METMKWRKSSYSGNGGADCVEMTRIEKSVALRDSKSPEESYHRFSVASVTALFEEIRRGRYDLV
ncbi:hypothetical protein GCM10023178_23780 [Actinomadura luteofluorescens]